MNSILTKISSLIKRVVVTLNNDDSKGIAYCQVSYMGKTVNMETIYPYGYCAKAPVGSIGLAWNVNGNEANLAGILYSQKDRFKDLKDGESICYNELTGSYIKYLENKDIEIISKKDVDCTQTVGKNKFNNLQVISLTNNRLLSTDIDGNVGNTDLINWVHSNSLTVSDDTIGGVNINLSGSYEPTITIGASSQYWRGDKTWQTLDTLAVTENTNLYYTDARARAALSSSATGLTYTSATGVFSLTTNYVIPTTTQESNWATAYSATNAATALNTASTIVKRDSSSRTAVSLQDDAATPILSLNHNLRTLNEAAGNKVLDWSGANLIITSNGGATNFSFERSTGRLSMIGLILNGGATLTKYNSVKENITFSGIWASSIVNSMAIQIIGSVVTIVFPATTATATTASYITSSALPGDYYPAYELHFFVPRTTDNGTNSSAPSLITISTHGVMKIYNGVGNFTGSGTSGFKAFSLTYSTASG